MKQNKTHLLYIEVNKAYITWCAKTFDTTDNITKDSTKATCKNCLRAYLTSKERKDDEHDR